VDPTLTRVTLVLLTLFLGPFALLAYLVTALVANAR
jgi:phage shock protein PspC (stress-responsive transcriptional regulator)